MGKKSFIKGYPQGTIAYVMMHGLLQRSRGRAPSATLMGVKNPRQAFKMSQQNDYKAFEYITDASESVIEDGCRMTITIERMRGCNGHFHVDSKSRIWTDSDGNAEYGEVLGEEEIGLCDGSCSCKTDKRSGFLYPFTFKKN